MYEYASSGSVYVCEERIALVGCEEEGWLLGGM